MKNLEQLIGFSLSYEYLRKGRNDNEVYILQLSQFYVAVIKVLKYFTAINSIVCLTLPIFYVDFIEDGLSILIAITLFATIVLIFIDSVTMKFDKDNYFKELQRRREFDNKDKKRLIVKWNLILVFLHIVYFIPFVALSIYMNFLR